MQHSSSGGAPNEDAFDTLRNTLLSTGSEIASLLTQFMGTARPLAESPRRDVYGPSFQDLCASMRIPNTIANAEFILRINGITDAAATAEAVGVPVAEIAAALQWTRYHCAQKCVLSGEPFCSLPPRDAHVWSAILAHSLASSADRQADTLPAHNRMLEFVPTFKFQLRPRLGTYLCRPSGDRGGGATFTTLCAQLGATGTIIGARGFAIPVDFGLGSTPLTREQQAAADWAAWLDRQPPVCMAGHIALLHVDDLRVLILLARRAFAIGRRGPDSLYGILVRAFYHALTLLVLNAPRCHGATPRHFPTGLCYSRIEWISETDFNCGQHVGGPVLSLGEALNIMYSFGKHTADSPPHPRLVGGTLILAPANFAVRAHDALMRDPAFALLSKDTWRPERFYGRCPHYWPMVRNAAQLWIQLTYAAHPGPPTGYIHAMFIAHLMAMVAGELDCPPPTTPPLSEAERAFVRADCQEGHVTMRRALARALERTCHPPGHSLPDGALAAHVTDPTNLPAGPGAAPRSTVGAARPDSADGSRPPDRTVARSQTADGAPSLQFTDDAHRDAYVRATFRSLAASVDTLRDNVAQMPEPHSATSGTEGGPPLLRHLRTQMELVTHALTDIAMWMEVRENHSP